MSTQIQIRRDTEANWGSENPVLADGEIGYDKTNNKFKIGNGVDVWDDIEFSGGGSISTGDEPQSPSEMEQWFNPDDGYLYIQYQGQWVAVGGTA